MGKKSEYQSDFIRHFNELSKFETNYDCDEMYLVLSTRYSINSSNVWMKCLFFPHWITVKILSNWTQEYILNDLAKNLEFVAMKNEQNGPSESHWHKERR